MAHERALRFMSMCVADLRAQNAIGRGSRLELTVHVIRRRSPNRRAGCQQAHLTSGDTVSPFQSRGAVGASTVVAIEICGLAACTDSPTTAVVSPGGAVSAAKSSTSSSYVATFDDGATNNLRSDGGAYPGGDPCATSEGGSAGGGLYQLRTIANTVPCKAETRGQWRFFTFDFGTDPLPIDFDQDGLAESIEAAPARLIASAAFAPRGAVTTPVTIYILEVLPPPGATTQNTKWSIVYRTPATVSISGAVRVVEALPANATADVYSYATGGSTGVFVRTVSLPFRLTLTQ